jgi:hypothetical protein
MDMVRRVLLVLIGLLLLAPGSASARPHLRLLADSQGPLLPLGPNTGYYESPLGTLHVVGTGASKVVTLPEDCINRGVTLGSSFVLCEAQPWYRVIEWSTGAATPVDLSRCGSYASQIALGGIGRYWIAGTYDRRQFDRERGPLYYPVYVNRETGECTVYFNEESFYFDLDKRKLGPPDRDAPKCSRRTQYLLQYTHAASFLKPCHGDRRRIRVCGYCDPILRSRAAVWVARNRLHAYLLASGRQVVWRIPAPDPIQAFPDFLGTRLYLSVLRDGNGGTQIYTLDLPRR